MGKITAELALLNSLEKGDVKYRYDIMTSALTKEALM